MLRDRSPAVRDAVPAALLVGIGWFGIAMQLVHGPYTGGRGWSLAGVSACIWALEQGPIALRRRAPRTALAVTVAGQLADAAFSGVVDAEASIALAVLSYSVLAHLDRRRAVPAVCLAAMVLLGGTVGLRALSGLALQTSTMLASLVLTILVPALLGEVVRTRRAYTAALEERARRLEQERRQRDVQAAREERLRISRELHDAVTHHLTGMVIEAGAAERRAHDDPQAALAALASVRSQGRTALASLRQLVGVLRDASDPTVAPGPGLEPTSAASAPRTPSPSLARLDDLVGSTQAQGTDVRIAVRGDRSPLPDAVDLAAYRILQEALTNVGRHAARPCADVTIAYGPAILDILVRNPAVQSADPSCGHGLIGMRERVNHLGGRLDVGLAGDGWWVVHAVLPTTCPATEDPT